MATSIAPVGQTWPGAPARGQTEGTQTRQSKSLSKAEIDAALSELNTAMNSIGTSISFSVDSTTKQTVVRVMDAKTHEFIRQIPSEEMLKFSRRITVLLGALFDHAG